MNSSVKRLFLYAFVVLVWIAEFHGVNAAGECGRTSSEREAFKLAPCAMAAQDESTSVSTTCCARIKQLGQNPSYLCAVMLSNTARSAGTKLESAMTIPKRCNLADCPVGYKCGPYTLP